MVSVNKSLLPVPDVSDPVSEEACVQGRVLPEQRAPREREASLEVAGAGTGRVDLHKGN